MNTITSSRLNILKHCTALRVLPWYETTGDAANRGTRIHEGIVKRARGEATMLDYEEERAITVAWAWLQQQNFFEIRHEVAFSISPGGGIRCILNTKHRDYGPLIEGEVPGTLDVLALDRSAVYHVIDWKTGNEVDEPANNWQLLFGAAVAARLYNLQEVEVGIAYIRGDHVWYVGERVGRLTLDGFLAKMNAAMAGSGPPVPGSHCRYCPAAAACPEQRNGMEKLSASGGFTWTTDLLSLENDAAMAERLPGLKGAIEAVEKALKERARAAGGIRLANGKIWKEKVRVMPRFLRAKAEELLGPERAAECIEKKEELYFTQVKE